MKIDGGMPNGFVRGNVQLDAATEDMIARREKLLGPAYRLFYNRPLKLVRGEGVWAYDETGRKYLDAYNNVSSVGHAHPKVVEAIHRQSRMFECSMRYLHDSILAYAEQLLATMPAGLDHLMLTCTGSEANDLAYRLSKTYTGGTGVIITDFAYHGNTTSASEFSPGLGPNFPLGVHVRTVTAPDTYRYGAENVGALLEAGVRAAIADLKRHGIKPAMLICDSIFASDGLFPTPAGFLKGAVDAIHEAGGLFVSDEVQPGFARTGDAMWCFQRHSVTPDIVTMGKPMGNGYPVGGAVMRHAVVEDFGKRSRYFNTFAGNPVQAEAAKATLDVIQGEGLMANAKMIGAYMEQGLRQLQGKYASIGDVRVGGCFAAVEFVTDAGTKTPDGVTAVSVVNGLREAGVLASASSPGQSVLKIRPPLCFGRENVDMLIGKLDEVLTKLPATR